MDITVNYCHDMKLFKMSRRNIGQAGKILADSGYQGLMKIYPQAQTPRKSSKLKPLTVEDKACNHALSKERSKVENIFAKVKTFKMFSTTYRNHRKRFGLRMNLIAGMVKDVNEDLMKGYDIFTPIAATDLGFEPGIPVIEAGPILFRIPAMSAPVFDNIEAAIKEHGLS
ncbi:transposase [Streptococcus pneumoniae]|nr:transposase [Streptococcus pneumoniae]